MRIKYLQIKNFLSFGEKEQRFDFNSINTIVGPNDSGKTNIFRAIQFVIDVLSYHRSSGNLRPFFHNESEPFEIELGIQFDTTEIRALSDFMICSSISQEPRLREKQYVEHHVRELHKQIINELGEQVFNSPINEIVIECKASDQDDFRLKVLMRFEIDGKHYFMSERGLLRKDREEPSSYKPISIPDLVILHLIKESPADFGKYIQNAADTLPPINYSPQDWFEIISDTFNESKYDCIEFSGIEFNNIQNRKWWHQSISQLRTFLLERDAYGDHFSFFNLIHAICRSSIVAISIHRSSIGSSSIILEESENANPENTINLEANLAKQLFYLKNSRDPSKRKRFSRIQEEFSKLKKEAVPDIVMTPIVAAQGSEKKYVELPYPAGDSLVSPFEGYRVMSVTDQKKEEILHRVDIQIVKEKVKVPLELAGAGLSELLHLLTLIVEQDHKVILLDEPALNLHPNMQNNIHNLLKELSNKSKNQIMIITHSPYFITSEYLNDMWRLVIKDDHSIAINIKNELLHLSNKNRDRIVLEFSNIDARSLLFGRGVVFTEGLSDKIIFEMVDRYLSSKGSGSGIIENEWVIIDAGGKDSLGSFLKLATLTNIPYVVIADRDALMEYNRKVQVEGFGQIKTSSIFFSLYNAGLMKQDHLKMLKGCETSFEEKEDKSMYSPTLFDKLSSIAKEYNVFILKSDLEGALGSVITRKDSKPLKNLDAIREVIRMGKIPDEISEVMSFIYEHINHAQ